MAKMEVRLPRTLPTVELFGSSTQTSSGQRSESGLEHGEHGAREGSEVSENQQPAFSGTVRRDDNRKTFKIRGQCLHEV